MNEMDINTISVYQDKDSTQIKYIKRCEVCKFAKLDLLSNKLCCIERDFDFVENFQCCSIFKLDKKFFCSSFIYIVSPTTSLSSFARIL